MAKKTSYIKCLHSEAELFICIDCVNKILADYKAKIIEELLRNGQVKAVSIIKKFEELRT